jgi:hypothetical protein
MEDFLLRDSNHISEADRMGIKRTVDRPMYNGNNAMQTLLKFGETLEPVEKIVGGLESCLP